MSCPALPLEPDEWNTWVVHANPAADGGDVAEWLADAVESLDGTAVHDVDVSVLDPGSIATDQNVERVVWRRTECDPMPFIDHPDGNLWRIRFVARGRDQAVPYPGDRDFVVQFVWLTADRAEDVPDQPPGVLERIAGGADELREKLETIQLLSGVMAFAALALGLYLVFGDGDDS